MNMKIISGKYKGLKLKEFPGKDIRPTSSKTREAIFDILGEAIIDTYFLDLFAGTGAIGIEALSRGVKGVTFVEKNGKAVKIIRENMAKIDTLQNINILKKDCYSALKFLQKKQQKYDIIFLDPPYHYGFISNVLNLIDQGSLYRENALVIIQHDKHEEPDCTLKNLSFLKKKKYGKTLLTLFSNKKVKQ